MYAQKNKPKNDRDQIVTHVVTQKKDSTEQNIGFIDNQSQTTVQRKLPETVVDNPQIKNLQQMPDNNIVQRAKWVVMDNELVNPDDIDKVYSGSKAPEHLIEGDTWDDKTGEITHFKDRMNHVFASEKTTVANKDDHKALIEQFEDLTASGGLLMHAVASGEEVESLGFLVEQGTPLSKIRMGDYRTKLLSYIRSDLTMKTFSFRKFALLVDWRRIWDVVGSKQDKATIYEGDQRSSRTALDHAKSYGESGGYMGSMGRELDEMARNQTALKKKSPISSWNEILTFNAITAGVVGLLWIKDATQQTEALSYKDFFTEKKKEELFTAWTAKTGMKTMPIYIYTHMGNPQKEELSEARKRLGKKGASSLVLQESYTPSKK